MGYVIQVKKVTCERCGTNELAAMLVSEDPYCIASTCSRCLRDGEIVDSQPARAAISRKTAELFKSHLQAALRGQ